MHKNSFEENTEMRNPFSIILKNKYLKDILHMKNGILNEHPPDILSGCLVWLCLRKKSYMILILTYEFNICTEEEQFELIFISMNILIKCHI